jgi:hypothetical protein
MHFAYRKTKKIFVFHFYENLFYKTLMNKWQQTNVPSFQEKCYGSLLDVQEYSNYFTGSTCLIILLDINEFSNKFGQDISSLEFFPQTPQKRIKPDIEWLLFDLTLILLM